MAMDLNQLQALLTQSAAASSSSPALQDQLARANALRDTPAPTPTRGMSYTSPLQHLARGFNQIRGQGKAQRANEGLAKYRQQMADADSAKTMYGLQTTADNRQQDVDFRNQTQADTREHRLSQALAQKSQYDQTHDLSERQFSETTRSKNRDRTIEWLKYGSEQQKYKAKVALEAGRYITEQDRLDDKIELEKANRKEDKNIDAGKGKPQDFIKGSGDIESFVVNDKGIKLRDGVPVENQSEWVKAPTQSELTSKEGMFDNKDLLSLNNKITSMTNESRSIHSAAKTLAALKGSSSPAAQLAAVFKFMKALDPTSVVRETEQDMVYATGGLSESLQGKLNSILGEGKLTGANFSDLVETSNTIANSAIESANQSVSGYLNPFSKKMTPEMFKNLSGRVPQPFGVDDKGAGVVFSNEKYGDITEADIQKTMSDTGMTRQQIFDKMEGIGG